MIDNAYVVHERDDEWDESAENEPSIVERIIGGDLNLMIHNLDLCIQEQQEQDEFERRDSAPLIKPQPPSVKAGCIDI